ncbi:outer dynein arm-docking complex subunit 2-like isoform X2 [Sycon ciliatum]|uniref:outer dynein arm-docking complex subunit 2-like isoform X2 n=1 Tax=Sycon ciliatum TaxID=27933 RepID=UPI0031F5FD9E
MGSTVSARAEYNEDGYLDYSPRNQALLEDMAKFVQEMNEKNPRESTVIFDRNFQWCTSLRADDFAKLPKSEDLFVIQDGNVSSVAKTRSGDPCLVLSKVEKLTGTYNVHGFLKRFGEDDNELGQIFEIRCWTFEGFKHILDASATHKEAEIKLCLEANTEPLTSIMGPGHVNMGVGTSMLDTHERLLRERARSSNDPAVEELDNKFRLCLLLNTMDVKLLKNTVHDMRKITRITPELVDRELEVIRMYAGTGQSTSSLADISYSSELMFANGTRASIRRQPKGDLCFITVKPHDGAEFSIGCNSAGYYVAKDPSPNGEPPPEEDMVQDLRKLLKKQSAHFSQTFGKEDYKQGKYNDTVLDRSRMKQTGVDGKLPSIRKLMMHRLMMKTVHNIELDPDNKLGPDQRVDVKLDLPPTPAEPEKSATDGPTGPRSGVKITKEPTPEPILRVDSRRPIARELTVAERARLPRSPQAKVSANIDTTLQHERRRKKKREEPGQDIFGKDMGISKFQLHMEHAMSSPSVAGDRDDRHVAGGGTGSRNSRLRNRPASVPLDPDYATGDSSSEEEEENDDKKFSQTDTFAELPTDYWGVTKLIKYIKGGNMNATLISLCSMADYRLNSDSCLLAFKDNGGIEILVNLLGVDDDEIKMGSLRILKEITRSSHTRHVITDCKGIPLLVSCVDNFNWEIVATAAETLARVAAFANARKQLRHYGTIRKFTRMLEHEKFEVKKAGALGLWRCSVGTKNKSAIYHAKTFSHLGKLLTSTQEELLIPVVGTIQECTVQPRFQLLMRSEGMVPELVKLFSSTNQELQDLAANAVFKAAEHEDVRRQVREYGGLPPLSKMLAEAKTPAIVQSVTGALYQCCHDRESVNVLRDCKATDYLVALLGKESEDVLLNVTGALGLLAQDADNRTTIRKAGGILPLVRLLTGTNERLLINVTMAIQNLAADLECVQAIDKQDGIRYLWSLLKSSNESVKSGALLALCPCMEKTKEAGEMVRSFVGGLELVINLLKSTSLNVLSNVCALIGRIAMDEENLAVITDHNVVAMLSDLTNTMVYGEYEQFYPFTSALRSPETGAYLTVDGLRLHLAEAIARCCNYSRNRETFGECGAVAPLVSYLTSHDEHVRQATCRALYQLSRHAANCITLHKTGVVKPLIRMMASRNEVIQENAACCVRNIRLLALANERPDLVQSLAKVTVR